MTSRMMRYSTKQLTTIAFKLSHKYGNLNSVTHPTSIHLIGISIRSFSASPSDSTPTNIQQSVNDIISNTDTTAIDPSSISDAANLVLTHIPTLGYNPAHLVMQLVENTHLFTGLPYWGAIITISVALRFLLLPVAIKTVQGASRMAKLRPDMQKLQDTMREDKNFHDMANKLRYQKEMQELFKIHKVNPVHSLMMPLAQFPIFISFFMGLKDMGTYFPGLQTGGNFWFVDLTIADPYYILPVINAVTFLVMVEIGTDGLKTEQTNTFKWVMRGLAVGMTPLTMHMPQGLFMYWCTNNIFSIVQTLILKQKSVKLMLDIPETPTDAETPSLKIKNPLKNMFDAMKKEYDSSTGATTEIIDNNRKPPPPPPPSSTSTSSTTSSSNKPPVTYSIHPKFIKK